MAGRENAEQFAEYYRSQRLGGVLKRTVPRQGDRSASGLDGATAAAEFAAWLRARDGDQERMAELDELAEELAGSWSINDVPAVSASGRPVRGADA